MLDDPIGGTQQCKDWGSGSQFKVCEISCNPKLRFSREVPKFYTCGAEGFWRPTSDPSLPLVYPACTGERISHWITLMIFTRSDAILSSRSFPHDQRVSICPRTVATPAQRVFRIKMSFPTSVLCNEAGQGVLRNKVRNAVNSLNRDWNFCSYSLEGDFSFSLVS